LQKALDEASRANFGNESRAFGEGGSIPFMGMLGAMFPDAQFVITDASVRAPTLTGRTSTCMSRRHGESRAAWPRCSTTTRNAESSLAGLLRAR
jgi:hypothetical protein